MYNVREVCYGMKSSRKWLMVTKSETLGTPNDAVNEQSMDDMSTINPPNERKSHAMSTRDLTAKLGEELWLILMIPNTVKSGIL